MLIPDDEKSGKYFGDFVHPNGDPIAKSEEVKKVQKNAKEK